MKNCLQKVLLGCMLGLLICTTALAAEVDTGNVSMDIVPYSEISFTQGVENGDLIVPVHWDNSGSDVIGSGEKSFAFQAHANWSTSIQISMVPTSNYKSDGPGNVFLKRYTGGGNYELNPLEENTGNPAFDMLYLGPNTNPDVHSEFAILVKDVPLVNNGEIVEAGLQGPIGYLTITVTAHP